jgi:hypothetical protein
MVFSPISAHWRLRNREHSPAMKHKHDLDLARLEDDLSMLEQHAKHVVSLLGRRVADVGERVKALEQSSLLFQEIREIRDRVHALQGDPETAKVRRLDSV